MTYPPRPYWHPLPAGILLGLTLLLTFLLTGHGLGASGFFTRLSVAVSDWLAPAWTAANGYFGLFVGGEESPLLAWISWEAVGLLLGALGGSLTGGRFRGMVERGPRTGAGRRLVHAFAGGILVGFGARLARGCTSGLGLSGSATLAVAGFVFLIGFFLAGFAVSAATRRMWQ